jgi:single-stranded-DNA-specific exonuclease
LKKKWRQKKPKLPYDENDSIVAKLAAINGIDDIPRFTNPSHEELHDPYLLKNIKQAASRIMKAIDDDEKIAIHADIDADGCTATAVMYRFLKNYTDDVSFFHSQRSVGHGIHNSINDIPEGTTLLLILDSSSNQEETCRQIVERGIDVIIIDHHEIENENKYCILVNPQQEGCEYPNKNASGVLVTWKVCHLIEDTLGGFFVDDLIDLVGLGLYSDQMSILEFENRYIVKKTIENVKNLGIKIILRMLGKDLNKLTANDFGYAVMPFVNAATRMDRIELVLELLTSDDVEVVDARAKEIKKLNEQRKKKQKQSIGEIAEMVDENDKCIVIVDPDLGKGFNGLVAGDIVNQFQKPAIILGESEDRPDEYHGSFRSVGFFNFLDFVRSVPEVIFAGGHPAAGGLGIKRHNLEQFKQSLNVMLSKMNFENVVSYDLELQVEDVEESFIQQVTSLYKVTGKHFNEAKFLLKDMLVKSKQVIGSGDTLKLELVPTYKTWFDDIENIEPLLFGMKFRASDALINSIQENTSIDIIGSLNINEWIKWKPVREVLRTKQMFIEDFRLAE